MDRMSIGMKSLGVMGVEVVRPHSRAVAGLTVAARTRGRSAGSATRLLHQKPEVSEVDGLGRMVVLVRVRVLMGVGVVVVPETGHCSGRRNDSSLGTRRPQTGAAVWETERCTAERLS